MHNRQCPSASYIGTETVSTVIKDALVTHALVLMQVSWQEGRDGGLRVAVEAKLC